MPHNLYTIYALYLLYSNTWKGWELVRYLTPGGLKNIIHTNIDFVKHYLICEISQEITP